MVGAARRRARAGRDGARAGRLRRGRHPHRPRGVHAPRRRWRSAGAGMWVLIREASNARNLRALLALVREHGPELLRVLHRRPRAGLPYREGHIDQMCRVAVARGDRGRGRAADGHAARRPRHGLLDRGAIAPGYAPTSSLLDDLESLPRVAACSKDGAVATAGLPGGAVPARAARHDAHASPVSLRASPARRRASA